MSNELKTPFRYDYVGSFLRPQALKDAKLILEKNRDQQGRLRQDC